MEIISLKPIIISSHKPASDDGLAGTRFDQRKNSIISIIISDILVSDFAGWQSSQHC